MNIRFRTLLSVAMTLLLFLTGIAVIVTMYFNADRRSGEMAEKLLGSVTARAAREVLARSENAVNVAHSLAGLSADGLDLTDSDRLVKQQLRLLRANPGITWISFSDTSGAFTGAYRDAQGRTCSNQSHIVAGKTVLTEYIVEDDDRRHVSRSDPDTGYDPRMRDFYVQATKQWDVVWLPPYVFFGQLTPGITCAIAVRRPTGELRGVISVDYDLKALSSFAREVVASEHSQVMVFTSERVLVAHSSAQIVADSSAERAGKLLLLADVRDPVTEEFQRNLRTETLVSDKSMRPQFLHFLHDKQAYIACVQPVQLNLGPMEFVATVAPVSDFAPTPWQSSGGAFVVVAAAILIATLVATLLAYGITRPISTLVGVSEQIGKGELNVKVDLGPLKEFRRLARAFELMLANLRDWVRVRTSLQLAMEIQRNLLPAGPPKMPGFEIAGYSAYCDETGGDYYDYILVDPAKPSRLLVALGDVMGHGLPSALLMAGARGILRSCVSSTIAPGALLTRLNSLLYQDTQGNRFMTMVLAVFDVDEASCMWSSAGHDPPIIYDSRTRIFCEPECEEVPLGVTANVEFGNYSLPVLRFGQIIFIGSDGVWETFNAGGEQFGKDRLKDLIYAHCEKSAMDIKLAVLDALDAFRGAAPAKDDVTFVVMKVKIGAPSISSDEMLRS